MIKMWVPKKTPDTTVDVPIEHAFVISGVFICYVTLIFQVPASSLHVLLWRDQKD